MSITAANIKDFRTAELSWNHKEDNIKPYNIFFKSGIKFMVAAELEDYELVSDLFLDLFKQAHARLQTNLKTVAFVAEYYDSEQTSGRIGKGGCPAAANLGGHGFIYIFGKEIVQDNKLDISLLILEHELLHLSSDDQEDKQFFGGPPPEFFEDYKKAMEKDIEVHKNLPELEVHKNKLQPNPQDSLSRSFMYQGLAFNSHVQSYDEQNPSFIREDWCEATSFYLLQQRQGCFANLDIEKYYPHRTRIIKRFLNDI